MAKINKFFVGKWNFTRVIYQNKILFAKGNGEAIFTSNQNHMTLYNESGEIQLVESSSKLPFYRSFLYEFDKDKIRVYFNDGVNIGKLYQQYIYQPERQIIQSTDEHICVADYYNGVYILIDNKSFQLETTVKGPKKDIFIRTFYRRT